ncbi:MAG: sensor domain-containing diguanylate cyclase [Pseudomonadaceae bacterium]
MSTFLDVNLPSRDQLLSIIRIQSEIARQGTALCQVMSVIVERCLDLIAADGAVIELAEDQEMVYRAASGIAAGQLGLRLDLRRSLSGLCVLSGETQRCSDTETDDRVDRAACRRMQIRSMLVMPLQHNGSTVGVLKVIFKTVDAFTLADEAVLGLLAEVLGADMFFAAKYASDDLYYRATHDEMTGVANRALFFDLARNELLRLQRQSAEFGLLMLDMDGLKDINDNYGHLAGDAAIREVATRAGAALRKSDTLARLGGDEFAVLLQPIGKPNDIEVSAERLRQAICQPFQFGAALLNLSVSVGASVASRDDADLDALIDRADKAMYSEKRERKRRVSMH